MRALITPDPTSQFRKSLSTTKDQIAKEIAHKYKIHENTTIIWPETEWPQSILFWMKKMSKQLKLIQVRKLSKNQTGSSYKPSLQLTVESYE